MYDRETGKPKGYGFCEYQDQETALSAMRNLNGREFSGRALRVDNAASEKNKEELKSESGCLQEREVASKAAGLSRSSPHPGERICPEVLSSSSRPGHWCSHHRIALRGPCEP